MAFLRARVASGWLTWLSRQNARMSHTRRCHVSGPRPKIVRRPLEAYGSLYRAAGSTRDASRRDHCSGARNVRSHEARRGERGWRERAEGV